VTIGSSKLRGHSDTARRTTPSRIIDQIKPLTKDIGRKRSPENRAESKRMYAHSCTRDELPYGLRLGSTNANRAMHSTDRTKRVKDARSEAQKEIEDYRKQKDDEFKAFEKEVCHIPGVVSLIANS